MTRIKAKCALALIGALVITGSAVAEQKQPLPNLALTSLDGTPVDAATLAREGTWLLVYIRPNCKVCEALLAQIDRDEGRRLERVAVIVGGMGAEPARELSMRYPNLTAASWLTDADGAAGRAFGVTALPLVLGMRQATAEWRLAGMLQQPEQLDSLLFSWLEKR